MWVLLITVAITVLDQVTKAVVRGRFCVGESHTVIPGLFDLTYVCNYGAAWGILRGRGAWLIALSVVMMGLIVYHRKALLTDGWRSRLAMGLMLGGILGNLIDRLKLQFVVDFLDFHWHGHPFPAFNVADSAICVGVGLYVLSQFLASRVAARAAGEGAADTARPS